MLAGAIALSIVATVVVATRGDALIYKDSISHLQIARRIIDSTSPGFGQLGGIWLPLPHVLSLPFIGVDALYYSGLAGTVISMASYVLTAVLLFRCASTLSGRTAAGVAAASVFALNPDVLYLQSTPMTELPLFAAMVGMVYGVQRWAQSDRAGPLLFSGAAALVGTLTRYEAWVLLAALTAVVPFIAWRRRRGWTYVEGSSLAFLYVAGLGPIVWAAWNLLIFGNPLNFQLGEYAKPSLWVDASEDSVGHPWIATQVYAIAVRDNLWLPVIVVAVIGLVVLVVRERLSSASLPTLSILVLFPFFVAALAGGQRPLHVQQIGGELYNIRFGLLMVLPAAMLIGYLVASIIDTAGQYSKDARGQARRQHAASAIAVIGIMVLAGAGTTTALAVTGGPSTYREPLVALSSGYTRASNQASSYLRSHDSRGALLMESFGNELVLFNAHVDPASNVYEGSYQQWKPALADPARHGIQWIVMRGGDQPDQVHNVLAGSPVLDNSYRRVFANDTYTIYERRQA